MIAIIYLSNLEFGDQSLEGIDGQLKKSHSIDTWYTLQLVPTNVCFPPVLLYKKEPTTWAVPFKSR